MDNTLPERLSVAILVLILTACASPAPHGDYATELADESPVWTLPVSASSGQIISEMTLSSRDYLQISIDNKRGDALAEMYFSDADCDFGHDIYISYPGESPLVEHRFYFDEQIPWDQRIALDLSWDDEGQLLVGLNGQAHSIDLEGSPRSVRVLANLSHPTIAEFRYQALNAEGAQ